MGPTRSFRVVWGSEAVKIRRKSEDVLKIIPNFGLCGICPGVAPTPIPTATDKSEREDIKQLYAIAADRARAIDGKHDGATFVQKGTLHRWVVLHGQA